MTVSQRPRTQKRIVIHGKLPTYRPLENTSKSAHKWPILRAARAKLVSYQRFGGIFRGVEILATFRV